MPISKHPSFLTQSEEERLIENWQELYKLEDEKKLLFMFVQIVDLEI